LKYTNFEETVHAAT